MEACGLLEDEGMEASLDIKSWDPQFYMEVFQGEFDTDLERLGIDSWLAADPILPLTHTIGMIDWLDATKDMRVTPIRWSL